MGAGFVIWWSWGWGGHGVVLNHPKFNSSAALCTPGGLPLPVRIFKHSMFICLQRNIDFEKPRRDKPIKYYECMYHVNVWQDGGECFQAI